MQKYYAQALNGQLKSPSPTSNKWSFTLNNNLPAGIYPSYVSDTGHLIPLNAPFYIAAGDSHTFSDVTFADQSFLVITSAATGSFVGVIQISVQTQSYTLLPDMISSPHDIGPIPEPSADIIIPTNSPSVVVGCGRTPSGTELIREQFWQKMSDSYTLAPNENRTIGTSTVSGKSDTSSDEETVSKSLSLSASGGWGPISASVSAGLSQDSTSMHSYTITEEQDSYESSVLTGQSTPQMFLRWQITDIVSVIGHDTNAYPFVQSSIVSVIQPAVVKQYDLTKLPSTQQRKPMSEATRQIWLEQKKRAPKPTSKLTSKKPVRQSASKKRV